jgi:uncharacterized protein
MKFNAYGHENLLGEHYNTFEFTKDDHLTKQGDCIIGINSDYKLEELKQLKGKIKILISIDDFSDEIFCDVNNDFNHETEMVIRKSNFKDDRTFAINASKAAKDINRELVKKLQEPNAKLNIMIEQSKK